MVSEAMPLADSCAPAVTSAPMAPMMQVPINASAASLPVTLESLRVNRVLAHALSTNVLSDASPCAFFYDLTAFRAQRVALAAAFPSSSLHCLAVKACPVVALLAEAAGGRPDRARRDPLSMGAECASIGEVALALAAGIGPSKIVFDAPAKTAQVIKFCLEKSLHINANGLDEVDRIASALSSSNAVEIGGVQKIRPRSVVGLRINPQIKSSTELRETFTAGAGSKFGAPLLEARSEILECFRRYPFLSCVHCHVGSQGCDLDAMLVGVAAIVALADEINATRPGQVSSIDIGGGLSVDYDSDKSRPTFEEFGQLLRNRVPGLFKYRIITEFGRKIIAKAGWVATRVEEVKHAGGRTIAIGHVGADVFVRSVYVPSKWRHRLHVMTSDGNAVKGGPEANIDVAGPLCFSGDMLAVDRRLPIPECHDWLVVRDAGAYTLAAYSRLTNQLVPAVYGYEEESPEQLVILKKRETLDALVTFWSQ
jgi:diaminopimelate decarboxylase